MVEHAPGGVQIVDGTVTCGIVQLRQLLVLGPSGGLLESNFGVALACTRPSRPAFAGGDGSFACNGLAFEAVHRSGG